MPVLDRYHCIYTVVAAIPAGMVMSYGEVARRAGLGRAARLVGRALAECPPDVPWHRVVNAAGRISLPAGSAAAAEQRQRLAAEGVLLRAGRVEPGHRADPCAVLDELLWGPQVPPLPEGP